MREGGIFADDAFDAVRGHVKLNFNKNEGDKLQQWWIENGKRAVWNEKAKEFE